MVVPLHWWKERGAFVDALYASYRVALGLAPKSIALVPAQ